jgi:hypothetical protein
MAILIKDFVALKWVDWGQRIFATPNFKIPQKSPIPDHF